jgi:hypothetical protein
MLPTAENQWKLEGVGGEAAFHDSPEAVAAKGASRSLGVFDAVLVTDISASFAGWHRASAGVPESVAKVLRARVRVPLFSCMVAFSSPLSQLGGGGGGGGGGGQAVPDAIVAGGDDTLWFAARTRSKPGYSELADATSPDCWTLISTPG